MSSTTQRNSIIPGFGLTLGYTLVYLGAIVLLPLAALVLKASNLGLSGLWSIAAEPRIFAALRTSFTLALAAAAVNVVFGAIVAWVLTRYEFPGRRLLDAAVDLPFALPTAVAGISLAALYAPNGWIGAPIAPLGSKIAYTPLGIVIALFSSACPSSCARFSRVIVELAAGRRGSLGHARRDAAADLVSRHSAGARAGAADRLRARLRARRRRIWLGDLHRRQSALSSPRSRRC